LVVAQLCGAAGLVSPKPSGRWRVRVSQQLMTLQMPARGVVLLLQPVA
jgi:hypothetical protein